MDLTVSPQASLRGTISVPGDKSITHRAILLASLAQGTSTLQGYLTGTDCLRTIEIMREMGVSISSENGTLRVEGRCISGIKKPEQHLDCGNSGTTMRLVAGILSTQRFASCLYGDDSLMQRPMSRIVKPLTKIGFNVVGLERNNEVYAPLCISPTDSFQFPIEAFRVSSAQVKSCLLLSALCAQAPVSIEEQILSRDHTERMLSLFGADIQVENNRIMLKKSKLKAQNLSIPGCLSSAAFFITAASMVVGAEICVQGVGINPRRLGFIKILQAMGASIHFSNVIEIDNEMQADIIVQGRQLAGIDVPIDWVASAMDEFPILFIASAYAKGTTTISGIEELRFKESDRIAAMAAGLTRLGIKVRTLNNQVIIEGCQKIKGGHVDSRGDHRIAMAFIMAAFKASDPIVVHNCANIGTSFPNFIELAKCLGLEIQ